MSISLTERNDLFLYSYKDVNNDIMRVSTARDLGVTLTHDFSFNKRISETVSESLGILDFVIRNASSLTDLTTLKALFYSLVRSIIVCKIIVWFPYEENNLLRLERDQNKFLRFEARQRGIS